jgi:DNA polymerase III subunit epsilon
MINIPSRYYSNLYKEGWSIDDLLDIFADEDLDFSLEMTQLQGLHLTKTEQHYFLKQASQNIHETTFCIVDIETNGSKHEKDQIIEIGAFLMKNGEILDTFDSLLFANRIPPSISELTGIKAVELINAPSFKEVIHKFRLFIEDAIIVAHPLKFDYEFLSHSFDKAGIGAMLNAGICNISLAERTLSSAKYGLNYLNRSLKLEEDFAQHRALNDARITKDIFELALSKLPHDVTTVQDLIIFSKEGKKQPRAALEEFE